MASPIECKENGIYLSLRVQPNARRDAFAGLWNDTHIKVALSAPAVDGKANDALIDFLADSLGFKKKNIFIVTGQTSRCKIILIEMTDEKERTEQVKWLRQKLLTVSK